MAIQSRWNRINPSLHQMWRNPSCKIMERFVTDLELAKFLGIADDERWPRAIVKMDTKTRAAYERLAQVVMELNLWQAGLGPKPKGVIVCKEHY